ncbi:hypothetical protein CPC08DRAFT_755220 [Agrocybe pediades]|nr:hypothetical protein CPC08DRAFT_755220 [Agrocybe pediades]
MSELAAETFSGSHIRAARYVKEKIKAASGYFSPPITFDALSYYLPPFTIKSRRVFTHGARVWEAWSPNAISKPFYPGFSSQVERTDSGEGRFQRSDGHLGRFDYTVSPQHYDARRPWRGFIKKRLLTVDGGSIPAEDMHISQVWTSGRVLTHGKVDEDFLCELKRSVQALNMKPIPSFIRSEELAVPDFSHAPVSFNFMLNSSTSAEEISLDEAVLHFSRLQRTIKEVGAWNAWVEALQNDGHDSMSFVPSADETLIGVWLNGTTMEDEEERRRLKESGDEEGNPLSRTDARDVLRTSWAFEAQLTANGSRLLDLGKEDVVALKDSCPPSKRADRLRSSAFYQGWIDDSYNDSAQARELMSKELARFEEIDGKIQPPAVAPVGPGQWSKWEESSLDDDSYTTCLRKIGKRKAPVAPIAYYDRENMRILYMEEKIVPPLHYDAPVNVFGLPAPMIPYVEMENNQFDKPRRASKWVYLHMSPLNEPGKRAGTKYTPGAEKETTTGVQSSVRVEGGDDCSDYGDEGDLAVVPTASATDKDIEMTENSPLGNLDAFDNSRTRVESTMPFGPGKKRQDRWRRDSDSQHIVPVDDTRKAYTRENASSYRRVGSRSASPVRYTRPIFNDDEIQGSSRSPTYSKVHAPQFSFFAVQFIAIIYITCPIPTSTLFKTAS